MSGRSDVFSGEHEQKWSEVAESEVAEGIDRSRKEEVEGAVVVSGAPEEQKSQNLGASWPDFVIIHQGQRTSKIEDLKKSPIVTSLLNPSSLLSPSSRALYSIALRPNPKDTIRNLSRLLVLERTLRYLYTTSAMLRHVQLAQPTPLYPPRFPRIQGGYNRRACYSASRRMLVMPS